MGGSDEQRLNQSFRQVVDFERLHELTTQTWLRYLVTFSPWLEALNSWNGHVSHHITVPMQLTLQSWWAIVSSYDGFHSQAMWTPLMEGVIDDPDHTRHLARTCVYIFITKNRYIHHIEYIYKGLYIYIT
jgi:hypothetical protein